MDAREEIAELARRLWQPRAEIESEDVIESMSRLGRLFSRRRRAKMEAERVRRLDRTYGAPLTDEMVARAEAAVGLRLPWSYVEFLRHQNGGYLRVGEAFALAGLPRIAQELGEDGLPKMLAGIGTERGVDGEMGSAYMIEEWGYPAPTIWLDGDGHTGYFLDYRRLSPGEEPPVIHLDTEVNKDQIQPIAPNFLSFLRLLRGVG